MTKSQETENAQSLRHKKANLMKQRLRIHKKLKHTRKSQKTENNKLQAETTQKTNLERKTNDEKQRLPNYRNTGNSHHHKQTETDHKTQRLPNHWSKEN